MMWLVIALMVIHAFVGHQGQSQASNNKNNNNNNNINNWNKKNKKENFIKKNNEDKNIETIMNNFENNVIKIINKKKYYFYYEPQSTVTGHYNLGNSTHAWSMSHQNLDSID